MADKYDVQTPNGIIFSSSQLREEQNARQVNPGDYPEELVSAVRAEFAQAIATLQEETPNWSYSGDSLGVASWELDQQIGELGPGFFRGGGAEEWLTYLAEKINRMHAGMYGGQYGGSYGIQTYDMSETLKEVARLMWLFPIFNPLIKQLVEIRALYVWGQGYEIKAESRARKKRKRRENKEKHDLAVQQRQQMQQMAMQASGMMGGGQNGNGNNGSNNNGNGNRQSGQSAQGLARNGMYQQYGQTGRASSQPRFPRRESLDEARSPAAGAQQGAREPTGANYGPMHDMDEESDIAKAVREFFDDPCTKDRFSSVEALQRMDKQSVIEGNAYIALMNQGQGQMPTVACWPTPSVYRNIVDDLPDGTGAELGYLVQQFPDQVGSTQKIVVPSMLASVDRLRQVMQKRNMTEVPIDTTKKVYHIKEWGPTWRNYGTPGLLASLNFAVRYSSFTAEWAVMQRVNKTYMMMITGYGNNKNLTRVQAQYANRMSALMSTRNETGNMGGGPYTTPPPAMTLLTGMSPTGQPGTRIEPIRTAGSTDPPSMGRELKLMAAVGMGYPDNMLSDTSSGTIAQADILERNTHMKFLSAQHAYAEMLKAVARCVVEMQLGENRVKDCEVTVNFPSILTPSVVEQAGTLLQLYQGDGIPKRVLVEEALKVIKRPDVEDVLAMLFPGDGDGMELKSDADLDQAQQAGMTPLGAPGTEHSDVNNPLASIGEEWLDEGLHAGFEPGERYF